MRVRFTLTATAAGLVALVGIAPACGPDPEPVAFWPEPSSAYDPARVDGILVPYEGVRSLLARWRRLQGLPIPPPLAAALGSAGPTALGETPGLQSWHLARAGFGFSPAPDIDPTQSVSEEERWQRFVNCGDDAFAAATTTLTDRMRRYGGRAAVEVHRWVEAQDLVFDACGKPAPLPRDADPSWPPLARADRAYQVAAARFYNRNYEGAAAAFERIAADPASPWRDLAPYLVARSWIRRSTLGNCPAEECLARAATMLERLAAEPSPASVRGPAQRLLGYVYARLRPERRRRELAEQLTAAKAPSADELDIAHVVDDYVSIRRRAPAEGVEPLTAWIALLRPPHELYDEESARRAVRAAAPQALAAWRTQRTLPWLVAALALGPPESGANGELLAAAAEVPSSSPAAVTVLFHRARWLVESGDAGAARPLLDALLARKDLDAGDRNRTRDLRAAAARDAADLAAHAVLVPTPGAHAHRFYTGDERSAIHDGWLGPSARGLVDETLPLERWIVLVRDAKLPAQVRGSLALTGWVRAASLDRAPTAEPLARAAAALDSSVADALNAWANEHTPEARRFAAAWLLLHRPELGPWVRDTPDRRAGAGEIDDLRDNWWCKGGTPSGYMAPLLPTPPSPWAPEDRETARREQQARAELPSAPAWMGDAVLDWARAHRDDPRVPEALHFVVRATRYGCPDTGYARVSRAAFDLLHRRYPRSEWAEQTPYWYD